MFGFLRHRRRRRARARPFPSDWEQTLVRNVVMYGYLPETDQRELQEHVQVFLDEKYFEGCNGLALTEPMTVTIAAQACLLLLHQETNYFPTVVTILVYPSAFVTPVEEYSGPGLVTEGTDVLDGEAWQEGVVILSWEDVLADGQHPDQGNNLVLHEFAHQLDMEDGEADGVPVLPRGSMYDEWPDVMGRAYQALVAESRAHRSTVLDPYGASNPAEFFAVATECFFCRPGPLKRRQPALYHLLMKYYQQDPVSYQPEI